MSTSTYAKYPPRERRKKTKKSRRAPLYALLAIVALVGAALVALDIWWPAVAIRPGAGGLASLKLAPTGETVVSATVRDPDGRRIPVRVRDGELWPLGKLPSGERLKVQATVHRSGWVGWLVGHTEHVEATVTTPKARVSATLLHLESGQPVTIRFDHPVSRATLKLPGFPTDRLSFQHPRSRIDTGIRASGKDRFGIATVAVAARSWETLTSPERVSWFPAGLRLQAVVKPAPGATLDPVTPITLTFSEPVASVLGKARPKLAPATPGRWDQTAPNVLTFQPSQGYALGKGLSLTLPASAEILAGGRTRTLRTLSWSVPVGTTARLQQLLAQLGYLPLNWSPAGAPVATTVAAQEEAAIDPPAGSYSWRYPNTPSQLVAMWSPDGWTRMTQGAVMAFENDHGLTVDGIAGPMVWRTLIREVIDGEKPQSSYSYVLVHRTVPQHLILWNDGQTVLQTLVNTGVPGAPTPYGTHAVFEHIPEGTMTGFNPDGSSYDDPGIKWISYFNGGEAIHGFNRASYGYPQSVGCVEAPISVAAQIWPYTPIGTLVSIVP